MFDPLAILTKALTRGKRGYIHRAVNDVRLRAAQYRSWTDEQIDQECAGILSGGKVDTKARSFGWGWIVGKLLRRKSDLIDVDALALGVEIFRRHPADLPAGSQLYPEQIETSIALTQRSAVQMDTGEGKTYALLPAVLALARRHPQIYVLCANDYLAYRDASRTLPFWNHAGLSVGYVVENRPNPAWSARVVYTTLKWLMFKFMEDQRAYSEPSQPLTLAAAVLVDEADAVLIDAAFTPYALVTPLSASAHDWSKAFRLAAKLDPGEHVILDHATLQATLTVKGENLLRQNLDRKEAEGTQYLMERYAVELAFIASKVVLENVHYIQDESSLFRVDTLTGRVDRNNFPAWLTPLAYIKRLPPQPTRVAADRQWPTNLLPEFAHLAGMSGTIIEDFIEYYFSYGLIAHAVASRFAKTGQTEPDLTYLTKDEARDKLVAEAVAAASAGRPVLVVTQSISEAEVIHGLFLQGNGAAAASNLLTGKNEFEAAEFFERAGEAGRITIATQLAGRGVDIRLTQEAKDAGGFALLALGHSITVRHDMQLLGRVGRQGDPFTARWFNSLDDTFFTYVSPRSMKKLLTNLGLKHGEAIEDRWINRAIRSAQSRLARQAFFRRRYNSQVSAATKESRAHFLFWFDVVKSAAGEEGDECSKYFLDTALDHFVTKMVDPLLGGGRATITLDQAQSVVRRIGVTLDWEHETPPWLTAHDLVGHRAPEAAGVVRNLLSKELDRVLAEARQRLEYANEAVHRAEQALTEFLEAHLGHPFGVAYALAGHEAVPGQSPPVLSNFRQQGPAEREGNGDNGTVLEPHGQPVARVAAEASSEASFDLTTHFDLTTPYASYELQPLGATANSASVYDRLELGQHLYAEWQAALGLQGLLGSRSPRNVAHTVLSCAWASHVEELDRLEFQVRQGGYPELDRYRLLRARVHLAQQAMESEISQRLLAALLQAHRPETLDALYFLRENALYVPDTPSGAPFPTELRGFPQLAVGARTGSDSQAKREELVNQFIRQRGEKLVSGRLPEAELQGLLLYFLNKHPLAGLSRPEMILAALEEWTTTANRVGAGKEERKERERAIRAFLAYLRELGLIGPLPRLQHLAAAVGSRLLANLSGVRVAIPMLGMAIFAAIFVGLQYVSIGGSYGPLSGVGALADDLLFGGALRSGSVSGLIIGALVAGCLAGNMVQPRVEIADQMTGLGRMLYWVLLPLVVAGVYVASPGGNGVLSALLWGAFATLAVSVLGVIIRASMIAISVDTGVSVLSLWLAYTSVAVLGVDLATQSGSSEVFLACFAAGAAVLLLGRVVSRSEVGVLSRRVTGDNLAGEDVRTSLVVRGNVGAAPHFLAMLAAWWTIAALPSSLLQASEWKSVLIAFGIYFMLVALLIHHLLRLRFTPEGWYSRLNETRQVFSDPRWGTSLEEALPRVFGWLYRREFATQLLLVACFAVCSTLYPGVPLRVRIQVGLFGLLGAVVCSNHGVRFLADVYRFLFNQGTIMPVRFEETTLPEAKEAEGLLERLRRFTERRTIVVLLAIVSLLKFADTVFGVVEWLTQHWPHF